MKTLGCPIEFLTSFVMFIFRTGCRRFYLHFTLIDPNTHRVLEYFYVYYAARHNFPVGLLEKSGFVKRTLYVTSTSCGQTF